MSPRLLMKLASLPIRRSWLLLTLMVISFAQLLLLLWFSVAIFLEIQKTDHYAHRAKFISIQVKDESYSVSTLREQLEQAGANASVEELSVQDVLSRMETEEPELVETARSLGPDGLALFSRVFLVRGEVRDEIIEQIKLNPAWSRVEVSPIHHARLQSFYRHLQRELKWGFLLILFLVLVQLLVFHRVQWRDLREVESNLLTWGAGYFKAKLAAAFSILILSSVSLLLSGLEWLWASRRLWKENAFLGELSLDRELSFPWQWVLGLTLVVLVLGLIVSFSGRGNEE